MNRLLLDGLYVNPRSHQFFLTLHLRHVGNSGLYEDSCIRMNAIRGFAHAPAAK
jgi:hypothetical protein